MQPFAVRRVCIPLPEDARDDEPIRLTARRPVVLFVSEDANLRAAIGRVLPLEGYDVVTARHSGHALLACLSRHVDILVTERALVQESGAALARRLKRYQPELRVVFLGPLGGSGGEDDDQLARPFTSEDLVARLGAALQSSRA
jgi:DNA-binding response OmpR family regulator